MRLPPSLAVGLSTFLTYCGVMLLIGCGGSKQLHIDVNPDKIETKLPFKEWGMPQMLRFDIHQKGKPVISFLVVANSMECMQLYKLECDREFRIYYYDNNPVKIDKVKKMPCGDDE